MFNRLIILTAAASVVSATAMAAPLTVKLSGVEDRDATLYVGVQTEEQFMKWDGIAGEKLEDPSAGSHTVTFDVPEGEYSVSVWHDLNNNGEFDMSDMGMPAEGWAISNGSGLRAEPTFDEVKVVVGPDGAEITETVQYPQ